MDLIDHELYLMNRGSVQNIESESVYEEAKLRRSIATKIEKELLSLHMSKQEFRSLGHISRTQIKRLLNKQRGGKLDLLTIVKAAIVLGLPLDTLLLG